MIARMLVGILGLASAASAAEPVVPHLLHDFFPGDLQGVSEGYEAVKDLNRVGNRLFFIASDRDRLPRLWMSEGTPATTQAIEPRWPEPYCQRFCSAEWVTVLGERALWQTVDDRGAAALWATDTDGRTTALKLRGFRLDRTSALGLAVAGGRYAFQVCNGDTAGFPCSIHSTDGTPAGTRLEQPPGVFPDRGLLGAIGDRWLVLQAPNQMAVLDLATRRSRRLLALDPTAEWASVRASGRTLYVATHPFWSATERTHRLWAFDLPAGQATLVHTSAGWIELVGHRDGLLYYTADLPGLWVTRGTLASTVHLDGPSVPGPAVGRLGRAAGSTLLPAFGDYGQALYRIDDANRVVEEMHRVCTDKYDCMQSTLSRVVEFGGRVFGTAEGQLYQFDGSTIGFEPALRAVEGNWIRRIGGRMILGGLGNDGVAQLWESDGTAVGTRALSDGAPDAPFEVMGPAVRFGGSIVAAASQKPHGPQIFALAAGRSTSLTDLSHLARGLLGEEGSAAWAGEVGGTPVLLAGNRLVAIHAQGVEELPETWSSPQPLQTPVRAGEVLVYRGPQSSELVSTDGTAAGSRTLQVTTQDPACTAAIDPNGHLPVRALAGLGGAALLFGDRGTLWRSDGTDAGTQCLAQLPYAPDGPFAVAVSGALLYFFFERDAAVPNHTRQELWRTDGTSAGTTLLESFAVHPFSERAFPIRTLGNRLFFLYRGRIWESDGNAPGTRPLLPNPGVEILDLAATTSTLFALSREPSSATSATTTMWGWRPSAPDWEAIRQFDSSEGGQVRLSLGALGDLLLFQVSEVVDPGGIHPWDLQLWRTDGTAAGTSRVAPAPQVSAWSSAAFVAGGRLLFQGCDDDAGCELWSIDEHGADLTRHGDLWPGPRGSDPVWIGAGEDSVYFAATDPDVGREVWSIPR